MSDIAKKPEKLATAMYFVTSFFDDKEPLKWQLRKLVSNLVSLATLIEDIHQEKALTLSNIRLNVLETKSLILISKNAGLISDANFGLMDTEFNKYLGSLELALNNREKEYQNLISEELIFDKLPSHKEGNISSQSDNLLLKDKNSYSPSHNTTLGSQDIKNNVLNDYDLKDFGAVSVKKNKRQSVIISVLKRKKEIVIKDIYPLISGCSEKTIQRELSGMVDAGILKRVGEKRWSKYSLAK